MRMPPILVVLMLLIGCTPTHLIRRVEKDELRNRTLTVLPFRACRVSYQGSVENEFGNGNPEALIQRYLEREISLSIGRKSCFGKVVQCTSSVNSEFDVDSTTVSGKVIRYKKPPADFEYDLCGSDILLQIEDVRLFSTTIVQVVYFVPIVTRKLTFTCGYTYWDSHSKTPLSCGKVKEEDESAIVPALTIRNWEKLVDGISDELLVNESYHR